MGNKRLLAEKEVDKVRARFSKEAKWGDSFINWTNEAQDAKTLRAVGEWYEGYIRSFGVGDDVIEQNLAVQALKQGKFPSKEN